MRRGLIRWDADELPLEVLQERMQRLRKSMSSADCDAVILYTNFIRCAAVAWLTGFSPYWADGILVVPREGEALFATTLSKRMGMWIQTVMPNASVVTSPSPGATRRQKTCGSRRAANWNSRIGRSAGRDFTPISRLPCRRANLSMLRAYLRKRGHRQIRSSASCLNAQMRSHRRRSGRSMRMPSTAGEAVAAVEKSARLDGAEEVYVAVAADLDNSRSFLRVSGEKPLGRRFAVRATIAYKGSWVRRIRTASRDSHDQLAIRRADAWFAELIATITPTDLKKSVAQHIAACT